MYRPMREVKKIILVVTSIHAIADMIPEIGNWAVS
jgi:hypothetical protein